MDLENFKGKIIGKMINNSCKKDERLNKKTKKCEKKSKNDMRTSYLVQFLMFFIVQKLVLMHPT